MPLSARSQLQGTVSMRLAAAIPRRQPGGPATAVLTAAEVMLAQQAGRTTHLPARCLY